MASQEWFHGIPPFPSDIFTTSLYSISLASLHGVDDSAAESLVTACRELGFFLLELDGDTLGKGLMKEIDQLFLLGKEIMDLPDDVKNTYSHDAPRSFLGVKPHGTAMTKTGPDNFEWFNLGQDGLMGNAAQQPLPPLIQTHLAFFSSFLKHGQSVVAIISSTNAKQLGLSSETFQALQQPTRLSGTVIRLIRAFASPASGDLGTCMVPHTDFGTITLLANVLGGLQTLSPGCSPTDESTESWVRPRPVCLIVNLGDAMVHWTGGLLRSNVHRIRYTPESQRFVDRYSLALLVRLERNASEGRLIGDLTDSEYRQLTAWEGEVEKTIELTRGDTVMERKGETVY